MKAIRSDKTGGFSGSGKKIFKKRRELFIKRQYIMYSGMPLYE